MIKQILKFFVQPTITYGITVNNEKEEITKLLDTLITLIDKNDEILVLQDITNEDIDVTNILKSYGNKILRITARLNGDFATFKNNLIENSSKKYLFQIDADELPKESLIKNIKLFIAGNLKSDCFLIPRINIVNGIEAEHVKKWNWKVNQDNYINYPDYQTRLFKLNKGIKWQNKVHEALVNFSKTKVLPSENYDFCLLHIKQIEKQERQNDFYDTLS